MCRPDYLIPSPPGSPQTTKECSSLKNEPPSEETDAILERRQSGISRCQREIQAGLLVLSILYGSSYYWLQQQQQQQQHAAPYLLLASSEHCPTDEEDGCVRPDLLAYKITSFLGMTVMGGLGLNYWYFSNQVRTLHNNNQQGAAQRLLSELPASDTINVTILCYQLFDLGVSLTIPEFRTDPIFLVHHLLAAWCAYASLEWQLFSYYSLYFGGCCELSSIFLVLAGMDDMFLLKALPTVSKNILLQGFYQALPVAVEASKILFTLTFTYYRVVGWILWSYRGWKDALEIRQNGTLEKLRAPGASSVLTTFLILNVLLGGLQLYWFGIIVTKVMELIAN